MMDTSLNLKQIRSHLRSVEDQLHLYMRLPLSHDKPLTYWFRRRVFWRAELASAVAETMLGNLDENSDH